MSKGNVRFKKRLKTAIKSVTAESELDLVRVDTLYTPVWRNHAYRWESPMESDGLLVRSRNVLGGRQDEDSIRIGVVIQSEYATSQTKPNPFGKALIEVLPLGVWVDLLEFGRVRLDRVYVLFVLPTLANRVSESDTARRNVVNAAEAARDAHILRVRAGDSAAKLSRALRGEVRRWLKGAGRPADS